DAAAKSLPTVRLRRDRRRRVRASAPILDVLKLYSFLSAVLTPSDPYCRRWALEACQNSSSLARSSWSYSAGNIYRAWHVRLVRRFATSRGRAEMETDAS